MWCDKQASASHTHWPDPRCHTGSLLSLLPWCQDQEQTKQVDKHSNTLRSDWNWEHATNKKPTEEEVKGQRTIQIRLRAVWRRQSLSSPYTISSGLLTSPVGCLSESTGSTPGATLGFTPMFNPWLHPWINPWPLTCPQVSSFQRKWWRNTWREFWIHVDLRSDGWTGLSVLLLSLMFSQSPVLLTKSSHLKPPSCLCLLLIQASPSVEYSHSWMIISE